MTPTDEQNGGIALVERMESLETQLEQHRGQLRRQRQLVGDVTAGVAAVPDGQDAGTYMASLLDATSEQLHKTMICRYELSLAYNELLPRIHPGGDGSVHVLPEPTPWGEPVSAAEINKAMDDDPDLPQPGQSAASEPEGDEPSMTTVTGVGGSIEPPREVIEAMIASNDAAGVADADDEPEDEEVDDDTVAPV